MAFFAAAFFASPFFNTGTAPAMPQPIIGFVLAARTMGFTLDQVVEGATPATGVTLMTVPTYLSETKDPADADEHFWFVGDWLRDGETVTEWSVTSGDPAFVISAVSFDPAASRLLWRYAGGVAGQDYLVTLRVRASSGRIAERTVRYPVRNI